MKDIKDYEGLYAITSCGKVWSYKNKMFLKPEVIRGYLRVGLYKDGVQKHFFVHRLVAEAYIPNPNNLPEVNHKNEIKTRNYIDNLEWCDRNYNANYGTRNQRTSEKHKKQIYCVELNKIFDSQKQATEELKISAASISCCCNGKQKTAGGYHFEFIKEDS